MDEDLLLLVSQRIASWKDALIREKHLVTPSEVRAIEAWVIDIVTRGPDDSKTMHPECEITGSRGGVESHHIAGKKYAKFYPQQVTASIERHTVLSKRQELSYMLCEQAATGPEQKAGAAFLLGLRELLIHTGEIRRSSAYHMLADRFIWDIKRLMGVGADTWIGLPSDTSWSRRRAKARAEKGRVKRKKA